MFRGVVSHSLTVHELKTINTCEITIWIGVNLLEFMFSVKVETDNPLSLWISKWTIATAVRQLTTELFWFFFHFPQNHNYQQHSYSFF